MLKNLVIFNYFWPNRPRKPDNIDLITFGDVHIGESDPGHENTDQKYQLLLIKVGRHRGLYNVIDYKII